VVDRRNLTRKYVSWSQEEEEATAMTAYSTQHKEQCPCFKQIWKVGKVGKVGRVGKVGKVGKEG
jgi:hypothetical protein